MWNESVSTIAPWTTERGWWGDVALQNEVPLTVQWKPDSAFCAFMCLYVHVSSLSSAVSQMGWLRHRGAKWFSMHHNQRVVEDGFEPRFPSPAPKLLTFMLYCILACIEGRAPVMITLAPPFSLFSPSFSSSSSFFFGLVSKLRFSFFRLQMLGLQVLSHHTPEVFFFLKTDATLQITSTNFC